MKDSVKDILVTGDQSLTDIISCCKYKRVWYQIAPWKKGLAENLHKHLPNEYYGTFKGILENSVVTSTVNINNTGGDTGTHYIHMGGVTSGSDVIEVDSTGLVYKNRKLGVGESDPSYALDVGGDIRGTNIRASTRVLLLNGNQANDLRTNSTGDFTVNVNGNTDNLPGLIITDQVLTTVNSNNYFNLIITLFIFRIL